MMYSNQLAAAIKVAGKVLREFGGDKVYIPFGSEYSIYLKNMRNVRAVAEVSIDGKDVGGGRGFVVPANGTIDIERFIANGNMDEGNRFKFIERTAKVAEHRGTDISDGLIEIKFKFERFPPKIRHFVDPYRTPDIFGSPLRSGQPYFGSGGYTTCSTQNASVKGFASDVIGHAEVTPQNETGVTAPGSISDQAFTLSDNFDTEWETHTLVFQILGETEDNRSVREAVTVKHKPKCVSCGTRNGFDAKFCKECGTSLQIV